MARARYVLRYRGEGSPPEGDVARIEAHPDVVVVDSSPRMLLVEADSEAAQALAAGLSDWLLAPDQTYRLPDLRRRVKRPPR